MLDAIARRPGRSLGALAALLVAGGAAVGTTASFTTQTVNPSNTFSAGILKISSSSSGAILTAANMVPGDVATGTVTISNTGNVAGNGWTLAQGSKTSTPGSDPNGVAPSQSLDTQLNLKVEDQGNGNAVVYNGPIGAFTSAGVTAIPAGGSDTYKFTATLAATGPGADNGVEGATYSSAFNWTAAAGS